MSAPRCTTVAGRHAAQRRRERAHQDEQAASSSALEQLADALARRGLQIHRHLAPELGNDRAIWVECRLDTCANDHALAYAVFDALGWRKDRALLSRTSARYDIVRLRHPDSEACVALIIKMPNGAVPQWEAA